LKLTKKRQGREEKFDPGRGGRLSKGSKKSAGERSKNNINWGESTRKMDKNLKQKKTNKRSHA